MPSLPPAGEALVGLLGLVEREGVRHGHGQGAALEERQHLALDQARGERLLLERPGAQRGAVDARVLLHQPEQVDLGLGAAAAHADHADAAAAGERGDVLPEVAGPHQLEDHVEGAVLAEALRRDRTGSEGLDLGAQLLAPDGGRDARAGRLPDLDRGGAHAAGPAVHEQVLARTQRGLGEDRVVGGREDLREPARLGPVERVRDRHRGALVHQRELGLAAAADHRHHAVALGEAARARAERRHLARQLQAGDVRGRPGRRRIGAAPLQHVGAVQAGAAHAHEHLALAGLRIGALLDDELPVPDRHRSHAAEI